MNHYVAELERMLRSPDVKGVERVAVLQALALHHEAEAAREMASGKYCRCGSLDSPNHRVYCYQAWPMASSAHG